MIKSGYSKKRIFLFMFLVLMVNISFVLASDVAYVYKNKRVVDNNVIDVFKDMDLNVKLINEQELGSVDFSDYKFIFVGDERFKIFDKFPVYDYSVIVSNYYFGEEWGLTDRDGISKLAANQPMSIKINGKVKQVYTKASYNSVSIPYYYLSDENRVFGINKIASPYTNDGEDLGAVIGYANQGTHLINGKTTKGKMCFYGIIESDYWTPEAKELFKECAGFVGVECKKDSDCPDKEVGEPYCIGNKVYKDVEMYECEAPGTLDSSCVDDVNKEFVKECSSVCQEGDCFCLDSDNDNYDACGLGDFGDDGKPIDCNDNDINVNPGAVETCNGVDDDCDGQVDEGSDICEAGSVCSMGICQVVVCKNNDDCEDGNDYTTDECNNPGSVSSYCSHTLVNCINNNDCGVSGFIGQEYCIEDDVYKNFQKSICQNPLTVNSYCDNNIAPTLINDCGEDYCDNYNENYCKEDNVYHKRPCYNKGCNDGSCFTDLFYEEEIVENCVYGCSNGACLISDCKDNDNDNYDSCSSGDIGDDGKPIDCNDNDINVNPGAVETCNGVDDNCDGQVDEGNGDCDSGSVCLLGSCTEVTCSSDSDCGIDGFTGDMFCSGKDIYQNYVEWDCIEPGTAFSNCIQTIDSRKTSDCEEGCSEGSCVTIICENDLECDDENPNTEDICKNPGSIDSRCTHGNIECSDNLDCGIGKFTGELFCTGNEISRNFISYSCKNPGTSSSFCESNINANSLYQCKYACSEGSCIRCNNNNDCNDNKDNTIDACRFAGTFNSYCSHDIITCSFDSDCGNDGLIGSKYCDNNKVYQNFREWSCRNPGIFESSCEENINPQLIETCEFGCSDGACLISDCKDNDNDNYDSCSSGDIGDDGKPIDCNDNDINVNPGALEICNGVDDDCDGQVDEDVCEICDNGIDDDGDGLIDGLVERSPGEKITIKPTGIVTSTVINSGDLISWIWNKPASIRFDDESATRVCNIAGYENLVSKTKHHAGIKPRCFWSPEDNSLLRWDSSTNSWYETQAASNYVSVNAHCIESVVCVDKFTDCKDGKDNDGDGKIDYCDGTNPDTCDNGCASEWDDSEIMHDDDCE